MKGAIRLDQCFRRRPHPLQGDAAGGGETRIAYRSAMTRDSKYRTSCSVFKALSPVAVADADEELFTRIRRDRSCHGTIHRAIYRR